MRILLFPDIVRTINHNLILLISSGRYFFVAHCFIFELCVRFISVRFITTPSILEILYESDMDFLVLPFYLHRTVVIVLFTRLTLNARTILCNENLINVHINKREFQCRNPFEFYYVQSHNSNILKML